MPSYIELDKQVSIPSASNVGKVILGVNTSQQAVLVDSEGVQTVIGPRPYKVYTALLTQSGEDDPLQLTTGAVTKGVTYLIVNSAGDFSNVGAPNNNDGTYFVATNNETPNDYGLDGQLFYDNGAPVVTVLENTIGNIWFTYDADGLYYANSSGLFITDKITPFIGTQGVNILSSTRVNTNLVEILTYDMSIGNTANNILSNTPIEIRVYN